MTTQTQLIKQGEQAVKDVFSWARFVAHSEFLWQDTTVVTDAEAWQRCWFEMEIINGVALAQWEEQGRPDDWTRQWRDGYQQEATELLMELLALVAGSEGPSAA
jgi:hypothetical protein